MNIEQWATKWSIPTAAINDLRMSALDALTPAQPKIKEGQSEAAVQTVVRLEASRKRKVLWRNNVGAAVTEGGGFVRYGLCNDSKQLNENIKSSDLIGISPVLITAQHVGSVIGQFLARETKKTNWVYKNTPEERAQLKFIELVKSLGGDAMFANDAGTI